MVTLSNQRVRVHKMTQTLETCLLSICPLGVRSSPCPGFRYQMPSTSFQPGTGSLVFSPSSNSLGQMTLTSSCVHQKQVPNRVSSLVCSFKPVTLSCGRPNTWRRRWRTRFPQTNLLKEESPKDHPANQHIQKHVNTKGIYYIGGAEE